MLSRALLVERELPRRVTSRSHDLYIPASITGTEVHARIRGHASRSPQTRRTSALRAVCLLTGPRSGVRVADTVRKGAQLLDCAECDRAAEGRCE